jgi:hypothetical protein
VLKRAAAAWGMGSPDIVPLFTHAPRARGASYGGHLQDFGGGDLSRLDTWAFYQVRACCRGGSIG